MVIVCLMHNAKITFEQVLEVGAAGTEYHLVCSQSLSSSRQGHVHKVLILQQAFERVSQRCLAMGSTVIRCNNHKEIHKMCVS